MGQAISGSSFKYWHAAQTEATRRWAEHESMRAQQQSRAYQDQAIDGEFTVVSDVARVAYDLPTEAE